MPLSHKDVSEIIKAIDTSKLDELVIELPDIKLVIRRHGAGAPSESSREDSTMATASGPGRNPAPVKAPSRTDGTLEVRAPMVGTFYRAASPKDAPFVEIGDVVKPGQPLCLIEVMKLYTTIEAKQAGKVVDIPATSGTLVEYDQVLFVIRPL